MNYFRTSLKPAPRSIKYGDRHPRVSPRLFILLLLLLTPSLHAAEVDPTTLFLSIQADPATTMTIQWLDRFERSPTPVIDISLDDQPDRAQRIEGVVLPFGKSAWRVCRIHLTNLAPDTVYRFTVFDKNTHHHFRTAPARLDKPLRFVSGGDCGTSPISMMTDVTAAKTDPLFVVLGGDIAYADPGQDTKWVKYLEQWSRLMVTPAGRMIPIVAVIGNHEYEKADAFRDKAPFFISLFDVLYPEHTYNVLDVGDECSLFLLDSDHVESIGGTQRPWLEAALNERRDRDHIFIFYHVPAYPGLRSYDLGERQRRKWSPLFEEHRVAAVFEHHDHIYKRTKRIRAEQVDPAGIVYIGDGGWGKVRALRDTVERWYLEKREVTANFIVTDIDGDKRTHTARNPQGVIIDQFETSRQHDLAPTE